MSFAFSENNAPTIEGEDRIHAVIGQEVVYRFNVSDPGDQVNVSLVGNPPPGFVVIPPPVGATEDHYTLSFTLSTEAEVNVHVQVEDSHGAMALHEVLLVVCPCKNDQPCFPLEAGQDGGASSFVLQTCNCGQGKMFQLLLILLFSCCMHQEHVVPYGVHYWQVYIGDTEISAHKL